MNLDKPHNNNFKVSVKDFILRYARYWPYYIGALTVALVVAFIYLRYSEPIYNANATLLIKKDGLDGINSGSNDKFQNMFFFKDGDNLIDEMEILKSRNLASRVVNALHLETRCYALGNIKTTLIYPNPPITIDILKRSDSLSGITLKIKPVSKFEFSINDNPGKLYKYGQALKVGGSTIKVIRLNTLQSDEEFMGKEYSLIYELPEKALWFVKSGLNVTKLKDESNLLLLSYNGVQAELGKDILNQLVIEYQKSSIEDKNQIASLTNNFINERLSIITHELGDVEKDLQKFKSKNNVIDIQTQSESFLTDMQDLEKQLTDIEIKIKVIGYLSDYLTNSENRFNAVPTTLGIEEPVLGQLVMEYNALQLRRTAEIKTTSSENPGIKTIDQQLDKLRADINENLRTIMSSAKLSRDQLKLKSDSYKSTISEIPLKEKELLEIKRQQGIKEALYLFLLQKREENAITLASTISNSKLLDAPIANSFPIRPEKKNAYAVAIFLGLVLPTFGIYLKELLNDKINSKKDLEKVTDVPIFGEIGHWKGEDGLAVKPESRSAVSEQFRILRSNLQYLLNNVEGVPVILTTSTFSGEGKSFISINTAAAMALSGKKTVILEFDLRKPKIATNLGIKRPDGFTNYLVGSTEFEDLIKKVPGIDNLYLIPCGVLPPNPSELLSDPKISTFFDKVKRKFDVVVMDTAPIGLVSDAQLLSQYATCCLYVVRLNYTLKKQVLFIDELYKTGKLPKMALLVNDIPESSTYYTYGHYSYGYGYGFGNVYFDSEDGRKRSYFKRLNLKRFLGK